MTDEFAPLPEPSDAQLQQTLFAPGQAATHPFGVLYQGEHETLWDGTGVAVRLHARALAGTGLPVLLKSFSNVVINEYGIAEPIHQVGLDPELQKQVGELRNASISTVTPLIKHLVVRGADHLRAVIYPKGIASDDLDELFRLREAVANATILYTVWERDRIDPTIAQQLRRVGQCWVPCTQNRELLLSAGLPEAFVVPHPYDPLNPLCRLTGRKPMTMRRFYSIGAWQPRKGFELLLGAFLMAFRPSDDVTLTLKISGGQWPGYPPPEQALQHWVKQGINGWTLQNLDGRLRIVSARLPQDQILRLHFENNLYVSSSHGEAWCLPAFDAKLAGNSVVHVPYGGTADFTEPRDSAVNWHLGPVHPSYRWEPDAQWANYKVEDLAAALADTRAPEKYERSTWFEDRFRLDRVGQLMAEHVLALAESCSPKAAAYLRSQLTGK